MKPRWNKMGGQLGLLICLGGLVFIWAGWNGAASYNDIRQQFPFLISGGIAGLALVMIGVGQLVVQSQRADRVQLEANLSELQRLLERTTGAGTDNGWESSSDPAVLAGPTTYHLPTCRLVEGRDGLKKMTLPMIQESGLAPCRTCNPPVAAIPVADWPVRP
jgi:hypothetical protein